MTTFELKRIEAGFAESKDFAARCGIAPEKIAAWESGEEKPSYNKALIIARCLNCHVQHVFPDFMCWNCVYFNRETGGCYANQTYTVRTSLCNDFQYQIRNFNHEEHEGRKENE